MQLSPAKQALKRLIPSAETPVVYKKLRPSIDHSTSSSGTAGQEDLPDRFTRSPAPPPTIAKQALPINRYTELHHAVDQGQVDEVQKLLRSEEGRKLLNTQDMDGYTPLHNAAEQENPHIVELLLGTHGIEPELKTKAGLSAADLAHFQAGQSGNAINLHLLESNRTTLHHAVNRGRLEEIHKIIRATGSDHLNAQDIQGNTPLHLAAMNGDLTTLKVLMGKQGMNPHLRNFEGYNAFNLAYRNFARYDTHNLADKDKHLQTAQFLLKNRRTYTVPARLNTGDFFSLSSRTS